MEAAAAWRSCSALARAASARESSRRRRRARPRTAERAARVGSTSEGIDEEDSEDIVKNGRRAGMGMGEGDLLLAFLIK